MSARTVLALSTAALVLLLVFGDAALAKSKRVPRFEDYPVKEVYQGKTAPLKLSDDDRENVIYYNAVAEAGTNFAGHYAVVQMNCGDDCTTVDLIDVPTGKIIALDRTNSDWKKTHDAFRDVEFRRNSRLMVLAGRIDRKGPNGWHFFLFDGGKLKRLHSIATGGDFTKPLTHWMK